ncbi:Homeotic protein Sex combs reduced [Orchesella cincta]|uniref:Homeotic protein Sex combs reduced n=1 Tax=Orchesella cincta TaxID=48709 RepID=A0A1D2NKR1_ORCCI|nr:Homeotic protein Sex combs reduced [Orchesella cincta]
MDPTTEQTLLVSTVAQYYSQVRGLGTTPVCKYATSALNNNTSNANNNNPGANNPNNIVSVGEALVGLDTGLANCGSPQDLTTNSNGSSASSSVCSTPRSPPLGSGGSTGGRSQNSQNSQSNSSHNSTSPNSNTTGNQSQSGNNTKGSSGNPPQIYPWMKRVHLGQSK